MRLFRYFATHADITLREGRLLVAAPSSLNDPFEFCYSAVQDLDKSEATAFVRQHMSSDEAYARFRSVHPSIKNRKSYERYVKHHQKEFMEVLRREFPSFGIFAPEYPAKLMDRFFRVCSFSSIETKPADEILLWSHYAAKHSGVRIGFEFDDTATYPYVIRSVLYETTRVHLTISSGLQKLLDKDTLEKIVRTKCEGWRYENEFRLLVKPEACARENRSGVGYSFVNFAPESVFCVDLGMKCSLECEKEILRVASEKYPAISVRRATPDAVGFSINYKCLTRR